MLALTETEDGNVTGSMANLTLELRPGNGRVFLDTFPLTKIATQISMRFAQQVTCKDFGIDCSQNDFVYTIESTPSIVGGPSAGAAAAVLTAAMLKGLPLQGDMAITGTINSGGIIGTVGGVDKKLEAAARAGYKTVLIPGGSDRMGEDNESLNFTQIAENLHLTVIPVLTLDEAVALFTGYNRSLPDVALTVDEEYARIMRGVASDICDRSNNLVSRAEQTVDNETSEAFEAAKNLTVQSAKLANAGNHYSAASFCFRANTLLKRIVYQSEQPSAAEYNSKLNSGNRELDDMQEELNRKSIRTLTDVQTAMAVQERILEAKDTFKRAREALNDSNASDRTAALVSYFEERVFSAKTWASFFKAGGKAYRVDESQLKTGCQSKIAEAEERYSYVRSLLPETLSDTRRDIDQSYEDLQKGNYAFCLYQSSKAKAEADVILSAIGVDEERVDRVIDIKLAVAKQSLARAQQQGIFPLVAYSYYEYAQSLRNTDKYSSLLFSEYALELGNLDIYFAPGAQTTLTQPTPSPEPAPILVPSAQLQSWLPLIAFSIGIVLGVAAVLLGLAARKAGDKTGKRRKKNH